MEEAWLNSIEVILKLFLNSAAAGFIGQPTPGEMTSSEN